MVEHGEPPTAAEITVDLGEAMLYVEVALQLRSDGFAEKARPYFRRAFLAARRAAEACQAQPSRSIMLRGAAMLASDCEDWPEALRLAQAGLQDAPPEIKAEIDELLEWVRPRMRAAHESQPLFNGNGEPWPGTGPAYSRAELPPRQQRLVMNTDPEWLLKMAASEDGGIVSVGGLVTDLEALARASGAVRLKPEAETLLLPDPDEETLPPSCLADRPFAR